MVVSSETPLIPGSDRREEGRVVGEDRATTLEEHAPLLRVVLVGLGHRACLLELKTLVHEHGGVAAVVEDQVGTATVRPAEQLLGRPPVLLQRLALPGEHRRAGRGVHRAVGTDGDSGRRMVLGREDVARNPTDVGPKLNEGLNQHGGLHGHVQRTGDARPGERLLIGVLASQGHQAGHLVLGKGDLLATKPSEFDVGDLEVGSGQRHGVLLVFVGLTPEVRSSGPCPKCVCQERAGVS